MNNYILIHLLICIKWINWLNTQTIQIHSRYIQCNSPISIKEIELMTKNFPKQKTRFRLFHCWIYHIFKENSISILHNHFQIIEPKDVHCNSCCKSITLNNIIKKQNKTEKYITRKENYLQLCPMNIGVIFLNKTLANWS